jgi:5-methylcytosine-specific restriction endonuclease McrA
MTKNDLNDPEYRWYHKEEMSKIMPYRSERKLFGVKTIDYEKLRNENDGKIKINPMRNFCWERLKRAVDSVPLVIDKTQKKGVLDPRDRLHFERRDKGVCWICGQVNHYGSNNIYSMYTYNSSGVSHLHHIIPNGPTTDNNIMTLCTHCHQVVHQILYLSGKWRYVKPV